MVAVMRSVRGALGCAWLVLLLALTVAFPAQAQDVASEPAQGAVTTPVHPGVVVVLAGGGAKGFAHLAVLRRLERDQVPIARIVGTSMGAVIGGLYAAGLKTDDIEQVIGALDPARVALDQLDRSELPPQVRAYQQQFPISFEFGLRNDGAIAFARGASDGQRFVALLQQLLAHVPGTVDFNTLKIPFRAIATRYVDGEAKVFDHGSLVLAIRASMAAPGVFAPVEIDGVTYVDGGLVANLPVEVALSEGASTLVVSALNQQPDDAAPPSADNALVIANQMISILIRQNERRNLKLLRPQDVLIQPDLRGVQFADFKRAGEITAKGDAAVDAAAASWGSICAWARVPSWRCGCAKRCRAAGRGRAV